MTLVIEHDGYIAWPSLPIVGPDRPHWRFAYAKLKNSKDAALQWYGESMEDTLLVYAPGILALGLALLLRLRRSRREASGQIAALQSNVAVLEQRTRELQGRRGK